MKKILSILIFTILSVVVYSQNTPFSYKSIDSLYGKTIYVTPQLKPFDKKTMANSTFYEKKPGKYKNVKIDTWDYSGEFREVKELPNYFSNVFYHVYGEIDYKDERYVRFGQIIEGDSIFFIVRKGVLSLGIMEGVFLDLEKIAQEVNEIWEKYIYLDNDKTRSVLVVYTRERKNELSLTTLSLEDFNIHLDKHNFCKLNWANYKILPDKDNPYEIGTSVGEKEFYIHYEKIHRLIKSGALVSKDYLDSIKTTLHDRDSLDNIRDKKAILGTYLGDTIAFYVYKGTSYSAEYWGYCNGENRSFSKYQSLTFINKEDADYLQRRGLTGMDTRKAVAQEYDSLASIRKIREREREEELMLQEAERKLKAIDSVLNVCKKKQIFILNQEYAYGEYGQFGLEWTFFNCFNKTIKYIELTVKPYNRVDDVQMDDVGRKEAKVKCIGPIIAGDPATFTFDELFWDDNDIIHYLQVSYIKITFKDNSTKVYSGWGNIKKRMLIFN